jgi:hypothetical protein
METVVFAALSTLAGAVITYLLAENRRLKRAYGELVGLVLLDTKMSASTREELVRQLRKGGEL